MKTLLLVSILCCVIVMFFAYDFGYTHPGRTDANGGHSHCKTGEYHTHGGSTSRPSADITVDTSSASQRK